MIVIGRKNLSLINIGADDKFANLTLFLLSQLVNYFLSPLFCNQVGWSDYLNINVKRVRELLNF